MIVVTAIALLAVIVVEFSGTARTHLDQGVNLRDELRAETLADTALVLTRACLDPEAWSVMAAMQANVASDKLCNMLLGLLIRGRLDLPIGGLSVELPEIQGTGVAAGDVEEISLIPESGFIGLAALVCPPTVGGENCASRKMAIGLLRAALCEPGLADYWETPRPDGNRYQPNEVIANLIDWVDSDDQRVYIDPATLLVTPAVGEGEDAYYKQLEDPYRSKDAPFDSLEELRMVRGIDDRLYQFLKPKLSVHGADKIDVNSISVDVLADLLYSTSGFAALSDSFCGEVVQPDPRTLFRIWAAMVLEVRDAKAMINVMKPYRGGKGVATFLADLQDPAVAYMNTIPGGLLVNAGQTADDLKIARFGTLANYITAQGFVTANSQSMRSSLTTGGEMFRLQAAGTVGNMSRRVTAVLKREKDPRSGKTIIRTVYYREE